MHSEKFSVLRDVSLSKSYSFCCDEMSFKYLYYLAKWNFIVSVSGINNACLSIICDLTRLSLCKGDGFYCHGHNFGSMNCSRYKRREIVYNEFASSVY